MKIDLHEKTIKMIQEELDNIPEKFHKPFNSIHEGYGVLMKEVKELEDEILFGEKRHQHPYSGDQGKAIHRARMREEAVQVACMAIRFIQELT